SRAAELLCDILFHSSFPLKETEKERGVIHEEIDMYLDSAEENILDLFQEKAFSNHALGYNILGTHASLNGITREDILHFYKAWYGPEKLVFVYNGPKSFRQVIRILEKHFLLIPSSNGHAKQRIAADQRVYTPFRLEEEVAHVQSYLAMGGLAPGNMEEERTGM